MHAWVLMGNHYHSLVETPQANLVAGMGWLQNTYTRRFNVRNRRWGHVFGGRYKAVLVDPGDGGGEYFLVLMDYIHLNPVRADRARGGVGSSAGRWPAEHVAAEMVLGQRGAEGATPEAEGGAAAGEVP